MRVGCIHIIVDPPPLKDLTLFVYHSLSLLQKKKGRRYFRDFLKSSYCAENLDFWLAVEDYRAMKSRDNTKQRVSRASQILKKFVYDSADEQINIPVAVKQELETSISMEMASKCMFDRAQQVIFKLMETDSLPRFVQSEHFERMNRELGSLRRSSMLKMSRRRSSTFGADSPSDGNMLNADVMRQAVDSMNGRRNSTSLSDKLGRRGSNTPTSPGGDSLAPLASDYGGIKRRTTIATSKESEIPIMTNQNTQSRHSFTGL